MNTWTKIYNVTKQTKCIKNILQNKMSKWVKNVKTIIKLVTFKLEMTIPTLGRKVSIISNKKI